MKKSINDWMAKLDRSAIEKVMKRRQAAAGEAARQNAEAEYMDNMTHREFYSIVQEALGQRQAEDRRKRNLAPLPPEEVVDGQNDTTAGS